MDYAPSYNRYSSNPLEERGKPKKCAVSPVKKEKLKTMNDIIAEFIGDRQDMSIVEINAYTMLDQLFLLVNTNLSTQ